MNKLKDKLLILNEKKYAEKIINDDLFMLPNNYYRYLVLVAKYYSDNGLSKSKMKNEVEKYMKLHYPQYKEKIELYRKTCEKIAEKYHKSGIKQLHQIEEIPITKAEIQKINEIDNLPDLNGADKKAMQRLLFTILVFGKWQRLRNPENEKCWCNLSSYEILEAARVSKNKLILLGELYNRGYIQHQKKLVGDNCYPLIVDDKTETKIHIHDLRELGYQWNQFRGDEFINCKNCGITVKINSAHDGMCKDCFSNKDITVARCTDCGVLFVKGKRAGIKTRCDSCQSVRNRIANGKKHKVIDDKNSQKVA